MVGGKSPEWAGPSWPEEGMIEKWREEPAAQPFHPVLFVEQWRAPRRAEILRALANASALEKIHGRK